MVDRSSKLELDPIIELYKRDVDVSLIVENLKLSPEDRLKKLLHMQQFAAELQRAGRHAKSNQ
jgi:hypothetical protein